MDTLIIIMVPPVHSARSHAKAKTWLACTRMYVYNMIVMWHIVQNGATRARMFVIAELPISL